MVSKKRSAQAKQIAEFKSQLFEAAPYTDSLFAQERENQAARAQNREAALRKKACESKNRYLSRSDAEEAIRLCAEHGTKGLHCYRCEFCKGWHLTSKPLQQEK